MSEGGRNRRTGSGSHSAGRRRAGREARTELASAAAELFGLPADVVAGLPRVELLGGRQLWLEGHTGLLSCGPERIDAGTRAGVLCVRGEGLSLLGITPDALRVGGKIRSLSWERAGERKEPGDGTEGGGNP